MEQKALPPNNDRSVDLRLPTDPARRSWVAITCALGCVAGLATVIPFFSTLLPSARGRAADASVEINVEDLAPGQILTIQWRGKPVWILRRTTRQLAALKQSDALVADPQSDRPGFTPEYAKNEYRSRKSEIFVCVAICTHLGCSPTPQLDGSTDLPAGTGGFSCPCHGSTFDLAGRVYTNKPASDNLEVPPHKYLTDSRIIVGIDENDKAEG